MYVPKLEKDIRNPLEAGLASFEGKWKTRVICALTQTPNLRYSALKSAMGNITDAVLTTTLKELTADQIINRIQYNEIPLRVEYNLTKKGRAAIPMLSAICQWTQTFNPEWGQVKCGCGTANCLFDLKNH
ncbi:winged helix-turn-helix transcriptional regulator [Levilactobacillus acidifarinae]|nr:winged helix-turn-helix transcriptional regulator [Levilactobacillus acidifarinae]GEO70577.1 transcriptional regulator [Levilactobacillus acidifarinae]